MMDVAGFAQLRERVIAYLSYAIESMTSVKAQFVEQREMDAQIEKLLPRQRIYSYWRMYWPQGKYPLAQEWQLIRGELDGGALVFVRVGPSEAGSFWIRLMSLTPEATPINGPFIPDKERDDYPLQTMCPLLGQTPANAIWECVIYSTRTGA